MPDGLGHVAGVVPFRKTSILQQLLSKGSSYWGEDRCGGDASAAPGVASQSGVIDWAAFW